MSTTQLSDVYVPVPFNQAVDQAAIELNAFIQSGVMTNDPVIAATASVGGWIGELPHYNSLSTATEPNYSSDDPASFSAPQNIGSGTQIYRKHKLNNSWSTMDLTRALALADPLDAITRMVGQYWATQEEKRVIQSAMGVLTDNVASNSGDMLHTVATDDAGAITAAELVSADAVLDASQTLGDHKMAIDVIAMHSVVYTNLQKQNLIAYIPNARGEVNIPTYLGYRVVVDDSMPAVAGTNRITYTTILFGTGAFGSGGDDTVVASEMERKPDSGDGGGEDILYTRRGGIIHPMGLAVVTAPATGTSYTLAELAAAATWNRVYERKNINLAFLQTNG